MDLNQWLLVFTVLTPFIGAYLVLALRNHPNAREGASLATAVATFAFAAFAIPAALTLTPTATPALELLPGLGLALTADGLGVLFSVLASFLWILTTVYSVGYMRGLKEHAQTRYYACFALVIGATMGVSLSSNLFSLFLFYEILTVATYPLVIHKESEEAFAAGRKYLIYTLSGGVAVLAGMMVLQGLGGVAAITFTAGGNTLTIGAIAPDLARLAFVLLFAGFGVKAAIMPLHGWLPSAMIAPTPVSGLLHAVAVVKAGVFGILRLIFFLYGPTLMVNLDLQWIAIVAASVTVIGGSLLALAQDDLKARLAYSTISQLNYITLGAALLVPLGFGSATQDGMFALVVGTTFAIAAHAFGKLTMFFVAGAVAVETGKTKISQLDGIGKKMPREFVAFTLAALSMICLPPMAGFVSKWYISVGAWNAGFWWVPILLVVSSILNVGYWLPIIIRAFFRPYEGAMGEARPTLAAPLIVTAAGAALLGLWTSMPDGFFEIARAIGTSVIRGATTATAWVPPAMASVNLGALWPFPPYLIFLVLGPLALLLKGRARQIGLIIVAGAALLDIVFLPQTGAAWQVPFMGYQLTLLKVDSLSYMTGLIFGIITFTAVLYAAGFGKPWMHLFALLYAGTSLGAVYAGDWVTLLFFWELMAITSTLLIMQGGEDSVNAGFRYLVYHAAGGALLGGGIALLFFQLPAGANTLDVGVVGGFWPMLLITLGIGLNAAFIPLHSWLPDAYPRAHFAASVFLSVYTTKTAVYAFARMFLAQTSPEPAFEAVAVMGAVMAVYGVSFAVFQTNMRRLLSYHIVSQVGYMIAGVGLAGWLGAASATGDLGLDGGMAHVFNHILYKALLFMTIGVVIWKTGENTLGRLGGLQKKMPITAIAFWIAAFSISGVPLFNGYISKGMVITAAEEENLYLWIMLEVASFGTFLSFLKLGWFAFLRPVPEGGVTEASDPPLLMQAGMLATAALCIVIGVYPQLLYNLLPFQTAAQEYNAWDPIRLGETLLVLGAAAAFFFTVGRKWLAPHETRLKDVNVAYEASGRATVSLGGYLQRGFRVVFEGATDAAHGLFALGRRAMGIEDRDVNWNMVAFGGALVAVVAFVLVGVGA